MRLPRQFQRLLDNKSRALLAAALLLFLLNTAALFWVYQLPLPDDRALPGHTPLHDIGPATNTPSP